jgi:hypothetical protein
LPSGTSISVKLNNYTLVDSTGAHATGIRLFYRNAVVAVDQTNIVGKLVVGLVSSILQDGVYTLTISDLAINGKSATGDGLILTITVTGGKITAIV